MATIITKNSSTASSVPAAGSLQQGELAVNVTDKKLYTKDSSAAVVKLVGSLGNQEANAVAVTGGTINGTAIGGTTPAAGAFTTASASGGFTGNLTGNASTVTNGVYTTGSYADPAWVTSLAGSKITGNISGNAANVTGVVAIANGGTGLSSLGTGVQTALGQTVTGSGGIVLASSPTLTTPNLGIPSAVTLTNATGLPVSTGISGLGTNVATALGVSVGSVGAVVVNGGALGTPSSGTVTNLTGTASININGTVGATTANTGSFTTLTTSSTVTHNGGTANGVAYLNGSKVLTSGSALTFDGTNLGVLAGSVTTPAAKIHAVGNVRASTGTGTVYTQLANDGVYSTGTDLYLFAPTGYANIFYANNAEVGRWTSTGLGIGTSSPAAKLDVRGYAALVAANNVEKGVSFYTANGTYETARISSLNNVSYNDSGDLRFYTAGTSSAGLSLKMLLDTQGNLGLGMTPYGSVGGNGELLQIGNPLTKVGSGLTIGSTTTGDIQFSDAASGTGQYAGLIRYSHSSDFMTLWTASAERARITSGGVFLVGTTTASTTSGAGVKIGISSGNISAVVADSTGSLDTYNYYSTNAGAFRFYVNSAGTVHATNTTISAISDQRFKENVQDLDVGLDAIMALKPRKFDWKEGKGKDIKGDRGFIAQEFEQVFPDLIDEWKDPAPEGEAPYKSVRQDLIPVLVKAIQELKAQNDDLRARLAAAGI